MSGPSPVRRPTVHLLDPGGISELSHHVPLDLAIAAHCRAAGRACRIAVHRDARPAVRHALPEAAPAFSLGVYDLDAVLARLPETGVAAPVATVAADLERFLGADVAAGDTILAHTAGPLLLHALAAWLAARPGLDVRVGIVLRFEPTYVAHPRRHAAARVAWTSGLRALRAAGGGRVTLGCDSAALVDAYGALDTPPPALLPVAIPFPPEAELARLPHPPEGRVVLGFFGDGRAEKGFPILARCSSDALAAEPSLSFLFQVPRLRHDGMNASRIEVVPDIVPHARFLALMARCHGVLVPYSPEAYASRTSHILVEALGIGRPVVAVRGGWIEREAACMGSAAVELADAFTAPAIAAAIGRFVARREALSAAARAESRAWREAHSLGRALAALARI